jgi:hypothetical protein
MNNRYDEKKLPADRKPRYVYHYFVTGRSSFPFDMLRYDACWPVDADSASKLHDDDRAQRSIHLMSYQAPTIERWSSFMWSVSATNPIISTRMLS